MKRNRTALRRGRGEQGQVLILAVVALILVIIAVLLLFDVQTVIRGKLKGQNAVDAAALTGAEWQKHSLNLIGELNLVRATGTLISDPYFESAVMETYRNAEEFFFDTGAPIRNHSDDFLKFPELESLVIRDENKNITQVNQYFLKAYFTIRPRSLQVPAGGSTDDAAQVIPAFTSTITDPAQIAELTEEELSYRYIRGGNTDGHPMYGEAASALSYVDIPLGGDRAMYIKNTVTDYIKDSEGRITDVTASTVWTWEPDYLGNLLVPFENPTPVMSRENITGGPVSLAGETVAVNDDGTFVYYVKDGDKWVPGQNTLSEYFVAGNLLCTRWVSGGQENREWWEVAINGSKMNWTALRKNKDGSTFTVTFEMNRVL